MEDVSVLDDVQEPESYPVNDHLLLPPAEDGSKIEIVRGPNIKPLPINTPLAENLSAQVSLKAGDNVSTDDITPASAQFSSMRSNIPAMSEFAFCRYAPDFARRAAAMGTSIIIGGANYGQGSSREHAAITPMYLGVKIIVAKSFARIHKNNLINHGILPAVFANAADYDGIELEDTLTIENLPAQMKAKKITIQNRTKGTKFQAVLELSDDEVEILLAGGQLRFVKAQLTK